VIGRVVLRVRLGAHDAHYGGQLVDGARLLALFGDVATELCVRAYGDEGLFRAYDAVEFLAPVRAGDYVEVEGEITRWGRTSLAMRFSARKVVQARPDLAPSAAEALDAAIEVCRASGTCVVPTGEQRAPRRPPPLIITAAIVGAETTRAQNPHLPLSPEEIGEEAARCAAAGAQVIHLHARHDDGRPTQDRERFRAFIRAIRARAPGLVIQTSTGGAVGMSIDERCQPLELEGADAPDMATLNIGTMNFGDEVFENTFPQALDVAARIRGRAIPPEIEIYDAGHLDNARHLIGKGALVPPFHFQFVLGVRGGLGATRANLERLVADLPAHSTWACAGVGRHQLPMARLSVALGGWARVGLEDNIWLDKGVLAQGSAPLVARVVEEARAVGRELATPAQARELLGLAPNVAATR
jgi:3-keto-5-aminohexanoate cleavage enzyme